MDTEALHAYFARQSQLPQRFGVVDCVTFCLEGIKIGWDRDYLDQLGYWDRRTAVERLRKAGGLHQAMSDTFGMPRSIRMLEPGDLIFFSVPATVGLLVDNGVIIKGHYTVQRALPDPEMMGWSTK
jgi:cell wall-associated NlpC family hydrolase